MASGTVKWFNDQKGYGFIAPDDGGNDVFIHVSTLQRATPRIETLQEGQRVAFQLELNKRTGKTAAANVRLGG